MLEIRKFEEHDHMGLVELWENCDLLVSYNDPTKDIDFAKNGSNSNILVGIENGKLVASVMVGHDGHRGWMYYVAVDPALQGQGYGRKIVEAAEAWLKAQGVAKAMLLIRETNVKVQKFYEQLGYESIPRIVMQRWLKEIP